MKELDIPQIAAFNTEETRTSTLTEGTLIVFKRTLKYQPKGRRGWGEDL
jgi:hypothetical protein